MPTLPDKDICCGCGACVDACPHSAIELKEDSNGFYYPVIDISTCIDCKLCERKCHLLNQDKIYRVKPILIKPFAAWSTDYKIIEKSATGGIFGQIAHNFLEEGNTYVYGAAFDDGGVVQHIEISSVDDVQKLQGSKYQQSLSSGVYKKVKARLVAGYRVLFSGTPCQIAALKMYLGKNAKTDLLYTIEIICHGVPTNELYRTALRLYKAKKIESYRHKNLGWGVFGNHPTYVMVNGDRFTETDYLKDFLFRSYLTCNNNRIGCSNCKYANLNRVADITIGDFWGVEKSMRFVEYKNYMGTSIALCNTSKGELMLLNATNIKTTDVAWSDFLYMNSNLYMPQPASIYHTGNFVHIIKHLPLSIQKILYQHGFINLKLNKIYQRVWKIFRLKKIKKDKIFKLRMYQNAISQLNNDN